MKDDKNKDKPDQRSDMDKQENSNEWRVGGFAEDATGLERICSLEESVSMIAELVQAGEPVKARALYDMQKLMADENPDNPVFRKIQAHGGYNLLSAHLMTGNMEEAWAMYEELRFQAMEHGNEDLIACQAEGCFNLLHKYCSQDDLGSAQAMYEELKEQAEKYENVDLRENQAYGGYMIAISYAEEGDLEKTRLWLERVKAIARNYELPKIQDKMKELEDWLDQDED